jgi:hypothetical protein
MCQDPAHLEGEQAGKGILIGCEVHHVGKLVLA